MLQACGSNSGTPNPGSFGESNQGEQATSVETITASTEDISQQIKSFGNIRAQEIVEVMPQVSNRVVEIYADLGDTVRQGDVLAKIYDATYRDQFQQAKSQLEQNRSTYVRDSLQFQRQKELYNKDLISSTEFDEAKATFESSKAQLESSRANLTESRENLNNTEIKSPVNGEVLSRNISEGDIASTGEMAFEIANSIGLQVRVYLPLQEWRNVEIGQPAVFQASNQPDVRAEGRVTQISPRLDPNTGLGEVVISITDKGQSVYQGVLVESTITINTHQDAVVIPRAALVENVQTLIEPESNSIQLKRNYSVFTVQGDSLAQEHEVELGIEQGDKVEILSGIQPGDQIVITGHNNISDSSKVRIANPEQFQQSPNEVPIETSEDISQDTSSTS
ncbi:efflux RND transporter periplasmic adaptor subunit [Fodinibius sp.]|uniref:efflux RND transporter periplasmic adaptor subunit n=1 Tax=Fodinibius sp. TaxID=1872440 RepID=UPI002ACECE04|nr:efflux RND transporter periplasmic adaptor subunit [Fodinibius sp.]MDZ7658857.1 efflux RND transporter periplasmic adaptor subunit [Fodinibius sp.]